ncbi:MAG: hypothetical protein K5764_07390 [Prevotella sp.]|nr:hypothetical protein [Prevotella sp.]
MNINTKRHIASWILLAVFVPMLILSSVHVHHYAELAEDSCMECVQHHCHGHLGQDTTSIHSCVLCQFLSLTFVAAALTVVVYFNKVCRTRFVQQPCDLRLQACGSPSLRAPPSL